MTSNKLAAERAMMGKWVLGLTTILALAGGAAHAQQTRLDQIHNKVILVFTPHPDDEVFGAGGTIALLNKHHNKVIVAIYTNDDKGSYDPEMTRERLAMIRRQEEEKSEAILGTPKENLLWMGYDDGMLEYAPQPRLVEQATEIIRRVRPDVLLSVDPGQWYARWHKTDHRMAAFNTVDAVRAAEFALYFPNQRLQMGLQPYRVPEMYFYYAVEQEASVSVNIDETMDQKLHAATAQVSQFPPSEDRYRPDWDVKDLKATENKLRGMQQYKDGHAIESFRYATDFNDE